jgi:hypothetical protein
MLIKLKESVKRIASFSGRPVYRFTEFIETATRSFIYREKYRFQVKSGRDHFH